MTIELKGRIDSQNAKETEAALLEQIKSAGNAEDELVLDMEALEMISSAGLRVILRIRQSRPNIRITNVNPTIYDVLDMTGFTDMMPVEKAYRVVSVEGCEEIGHGANGTIYRIDRDNVVKVLKNPEMLDQIRHEREVAKLALVLGIPTAISYEVVRVGDSYGAVFELLNARSFAKILAGEPEKLDWCVDEFVTMLKKIHGTLVPEGKLPDMRETALKWVRFMAEYLPADKYEKLLAMTEAVPHDNHMIHGDYHTRNLELQNDEVLLIDMDTLSVGHPVFELGSIYNSLVGFYETDPEGILKFQGFDRETGILFWKKALAGYLETSDEERIREVEDKARILGYTRLFRRAIHRNLNETEEGRIACDHWRQELTELIDRTDTLVF